MKHTILLLFISLLSSFGQAQVAINKLPNNAGAILDFATGTTNGIILSAVSTLPPNPANGTFVVDKKDLKIKMRQNNTWVDMSSPGDLSRVATNVSSEICTGVIIGSTTSPAVVFWCWKLQIKPLLCLGLLPHTSMSEVPIQG